MTTFLARLAPVGLIAFLMLLAFSFYRRTREWDALLMLGVLAVIGIVYCVLAKPWEGWP